MNHHEFCDKELAELCAKSDKNAQEMLYTRYAAMLHALCYRYVSDEEDARDLTHDVMIQVFRNIHKFRWSGKGSLEAWIRRVGVNLAIDSLRKGKRLRLTGVDQITIEDKDLIETPSDVDRLMEVPREVLLEMVASLPDVQRTVFNLYCLDGFAHKEIARALGIAENSSSSALSRAKCTLKRLINNYLNSNP